MQITEEIKDFKYGKGLFYSTIINGEKFVSQIVLRDKFGNFPERWKIIVKRQVEDLIHLKKCKS
jgi:hypothetical protein